MKKLLLYTIVIIGVLNFTVAQNVNNVAQKALTQDVVPQKAYPIPGSHFLREKEQKLIEYFEQHPEAKRLSKPLSTEDWGFTVGSTKEFWADYFEDQLD